MIERAVRVGEIEVMTRHWPQLDRAVATGPAVVLLHEGLGSSTQWRELPQRIREQTSSDVYAYDRPGYGRSSPAPAQFTPEFMHHEATVTLPAVLAALDIERPVLIGHSDGASIALLAAAHEPSADAGTTDAPHVEPAAVGVIAPHIRVEQECLDGITAIAARRDAIVSGLARHHDHAELVFDRWRDVWLDPSFRSWDITAHLPAISCPVIAVQGDRDEYATPAMVNDLVELVPDSRGYFLTDCGHVAHRDQPDAVLDLVLDTVERGSVS